ATATGVLPPPPPGPPGPPRCRPPAGPCTWSRCTATALHGAPLREPGQAGAPGRVGSAGAVVGDAEQQHARYVLIQDPGISDSELKRLLLSAYERVARLTSNASDFLDDCITVAREPSV